MKEDTLHVLLELDATATPTYWFAQGYEVDYFAQGATVEEVVYNFVRGLRLTVEANQTAKHLHLFLESKSPEGIRDKIGATVLATQVLDIAGLSYKQVSFHGVSEAN